MPRNPTLQQIDSDQFYKFLNSPDSLTVVLRGHIGLEVVLNHVLNRSLALGLSDDLGRIGFMQKVDLAIGLGKIDADPRPLFQKINAVRNRYAHQLTARLTRQDGREALALLPPWADRRPADDPAITGAAALAWCMAVLWSRAMNRGMFDHAPELPA